MNLWLKRRFFLFPPSRDGRINSEEGEILTIPK